MFKHFLQGNLWIWVSQTDCIQSSDHGVSTTWERTRCWPSCWYKDAPFLLMLVIGFWMKDVREVGQLTSHRLQHCLSSLNDCLSYSLVTSWILATHNVIFKWTARLASLKSSLLTCEIWELNVDHFRSPCCECWQTDEGRNAVE